MMESFPNGVWPSLCPILFRSCQNRVAGLLTSVDIAPILSEYASEDIFVKMHQYPFYMKYNLKPPAQFVVTRFVLEHITERFCKSALAR